GAPAFPQRRRRGIGHEEVAALGARRRVERQSAVIGLGTLQEADGTVMREMRGAPESVDGAVINKRVERGLPIALLAGEGCRQGGGEQPRREPSAAARRRDGRYPPAWRRCRRARRTGRGRARRRRTRPS